MGNCESKPKKCNFFRSRFRSLSREQVARCRNKKFATKFPSSRAPVLVARRVHPGRQRALRDKELPGLGAREMPVMRRVFVDKKKDGMSGDEGKCGKKEEMI